MKTGFWTQIDEDLQDFEILESEVLGKLDGYEVDLSFFLHGYCTIAAIVLHEQFGYPMYRQWDEDEVEACGNPSLSLSEFPVIHDFCKARNGFVDIRGIIDDSESFFAEFEDFFEEVDYTILSDEEFAEAKKNYRTDIGSSTFSRLYQMCANWIEKHSNYYTERS